METTRASQNMDSLLSKLFSSLTNQILRFNTEEEQVLIFIICNNYGNILYLFKCKFKLEGLFESEFDSSNEI